MNNQTEHLPDTAGMLQVISKCLIEGNCPSLASHCDRASKEILELRAKVEHLEKLSSRILEEQYKNELYDKLGNEDYERNETQSTFRKIVQQLILCGAITSTNVQDTSWTSLALNHSKPSWMQHLEKEQMLAFKDNLKGASV